MKIIAAPNAFKGSLSAMEAAEAIQKGVLAANPTCDVVCVPAADGGDGLTEVMVQALSGTIIHCNVKGPRMEILPSLFCFVKEEKLAVIEMAKASGLALIPENLQDPTQTTSFGTGCSNVYGREDVRCSNVGFGFDNFVYKPNYFY